MPSSTYTIPGISDYYHVWRFTGPYINHSTAPYGTYSTTYIAPPAQAVRMKPDPPEINREEWSNFMDSDDE